MTQSNENARSYELMLVLKADKGDDAIQQHVADIKKLITDLDGDVFFEDVWGRRELTYRIRKEGAGYYVVLDFNIDGSKLKEISDNLRIDQVILRSLLTKTPDGYKPTAITEADLEWTKRIKKDDETEEKEEEAEKPVKEKAVRKKPEVKEEVVALEPRAEEEEVVEEAPEAEEAAPEVKAEEEAPEEAPAKEKKKEKKAPKVEDEKKTMDDLDEKLKAIMNDTDLDISL